VAQAYLRGIDRHPKAHRVTSVASLFVSRLDVAADRLLEEIGSPDALSLRGRIGIANAKRVYRRFRELFDGEPFAALKRRGARVQRPLWASTGTKNVSYSDVLYIESLIGPDTITTVPPATLDAFRDHGRVRVTLGTEGEAEGELAAAATLGLDMHAITQELQADAINAFASSSDQLIATVGEKRSQIIATAS
jgi:transaldolase